jgi:hypothetical protein
MNWLYVMVWALEKDESGVGFKANGSKPQTCKKNAWIDVNGLKFFHESTMVAPNDTTILEFSDTTQYQLAMKLHEFEELYFDEIEKK